MWNETGDAFFQGTRNAQALKQLLNFDQDRSMAIEDRSFQRRRLQDQDQIDQALALGRILAGGGRIVDEGGMVQEMLSGKDRSMWNAAGVIGVDSVQRPAESGRTRILPGGGRVELATADENANRELDLLDRRGRLSNEQLVAKMFATDQAENTIRQQTGAPVNVGGRMVNLTPEEVAKNLPLLDRMTRRQALPGMQQYGAMSPDEYGGFSSLLRNLLPDFDRNTNYATGDVSYSAVDPVTGQPRTVTSPQWQGVAQTRPRGASPGGKATNGEKPLTNLQRADMMAEKVLAENRGGDIESAIRNAQQFYQGDPDMTPTVRNLVVSKLRKMARSPKPKGGAGAPTASAAPAAADWVYDAAMGQLVRAKK